MGAKGRTNAIGALLAGTLLTVSLFQTTINTVIFDTWAIECLIPKLSPKSVVILDNASFHKGKAMQKAMEDAGHILLCLPPYSPDLTPSRKNGPTQNPFIANFSALLMTFLPFPTYSHFILIHYIDYIIRLLSCQHIDGT